MKLRIKDLSFVTGGAFVSIMNSTDAREIDLHPGDRILISMNNKKIISVVDLSEDEKIKKGEIGLFDEILDYLKTRKGYVNVKIAKRLKSLGYIKKKLEGKKLNRKEIFEIIKDINSNNLNEVELTYFVSGCYSHGLSMHEIEDMTDAIVKAGHRLKLKKHPIVDKHCIGGVPGNRTTMIVVPIIASLGITMPKTSSRAISSPAGTSDTMEALANVSFEVNEIKRIVEKINGCIVWGGVVDLASADDKMIKVRNPLRLDPEGLLLASIMAKKKVLDSLNSGKAYEKMKEIIKAQKGHIFRPEQLKLAKFNKNIHSTRSGIVKEINNKDVSKIARTAGAPVDKKAGIYLNKKLRDKVKKDELLFTVYASSQKRLNYALELVKERNPYVIS